MPLYSSALRRRLLLLGACLFAWSGCATAPRPASASGSAAAPRLAHHLRGTNGPLLVLQSGLGDGAASWDPLLRELPPTARVFTYDRPGYGRSPAVTGPRDPATIATELHALLHQLNLPPPYVLVGHSLGGLYQYAFAQQYPDEVAGLVLIDPTHPDHWARMQKEAPTSAVLIKALRHTVFSSAARREFDDQTGGASLTNRPLPARPTVFLFSQVFRPEERGRFETLVRNLRSDWQRLVPGATQLEVSGAGHYVHHDRPRLVADQIAALLAQLTDRR